MRERGGKGWILDSTLFADKTRFIGSSRWLLLSWTHDLSLSGRCDRTGRREFQGLTLLLSLLLFLFLLLLPCLGARAFLPYLSSFRLEKYLFGERFANDLINPWKAQSSVAVSLWAEQLRPRKENNYRYRAFLPLFYTLSYILSTFNRSTWSQKYPLPLFFSLFIFGMLLFAPSFFSYRWKTLTDIAFAQMSNR